MAWYDSLGEATMQVVRLPEHLEGCPYCRVAEGEEHFPACPVGQGLVALVIVRGRK